MAESYETRFQAAIENQRLADERAMVETYELTQEDANQELDSWNDWENKYCDSYCDTDLYWHWYCHVYAETSENEADILVTRYNRMEYVHIDAILKEPRASRSISWPLSILDKYDAESGKTGYEIYEEMKLLEISMRARGNRYAIIYHKAKYDLEYESDCDYDPSDAELIANDYAIMERSARDD